MSRKMLAVALFALVTPVAVSQAQLSFGIGAGASVPTGDTKPYTATGYHLMATAGIHPPLAPVGFRVDGMFHEFDAKPATADTKIRVMGATANAVLSMPGAIVLSPYVIGGVGTYNYKVKTPTTSSDMNELGVNIGAGIKFGLAGFGAFGEVRYHAIMNDGTDKIRFIPVTFGIMF
jgi:hypothetical protein